ncbi:MAG: hypothetical protein JOZ74_15610 [Bradyrhizobium sp.]|nr:hypothetical protein [Bradyrhizobium sp.]
MPSPTPISLPLAGRGENIAARWLLPFCVGVGAYLICFFNGDGLLQDSDSFWQIKVGQWIIAHRAVPYSDIYSLLHQGESWISNAWLSQVLYAVSYAQFGWAGPVVLASFAIGTTFAILVFLLDKHCEPAHSVLLAMLAFVLCFNHLLARPHVLALPVMAAWIGALMSAADRRTSPSFFWLPLMTLWASLHGGFALGLALIAPVALEAVWTAAPEQRVALAARWALFALGALIACCCTPYGWNTLIAASRILALGQLLSVIAEWMPQNFSSINPFEASLLGLLALGYYSGIVLSIPRILLLLLLVFMALTHIRNIEAYALVTPLVLAQPFATRKQATDSVKRWAGEFCSLPFISGLTRAVIAGCVSASTLTYADHHEFVFAKRQTPVAALDLLEKRGTKRIFNSYAFGGYMIARDMPPFIDGRAELYGEKLVMTYFNAVEGRRMDNLLTMLDEYDMEATLLAADSPAGLLMDHAPGWTRLYADDTAVIHVRSGPSSPPMPPRPAKPS